MKTPSLFSIAPTSLPSFFLYQVSVHFLNKTNYGRIYTCVYINRSGGDWQLQEVIHFSFNHAFLGDSPLGTHLLEQCEITETNASFGLTQIVLK